MQQNKERLMRTLLTLAILLAGVAMVPFMDMPAAAIKWQKLAGIYEPELDVNETTGAPGSIFAFTGTGYPPNTLATVFSNGRIIGTVPIDSSGTGHFLLNTAGADVGEYDITLEVDMNASATETIRLEADAEQVTPPVGFEGVTVELAYIIYLPIVRRD